MKNSLCFHSNNCLKNIESFRNTFEFNYVFRLYAVAAHHLINTAHLGILLEKYAKLFGSVHRMLSYLQQKVSSSFNKIFSYLGRCYWQLQVFMEMYLAFDLRFIIFTTFFQCDGVCFLRSSWKRNALLAH